MGDIDVPFMTWHLAILGIPLFWASIVLGILQFWEFHSPGHPTVLVIQQSRPGFYRSPFRSFCSCFLNIRCPRGKPYFPLDGNAEGSRTGAVALQQSTCPACAEALGSLPRTEAADFTMSFSLLCSLLPFGLSLCSSGCCLSNTMALRTRDGCDLTPGVLT